jgi:hypothetical protein
MTPKAWLAWLIVFVAAAPAARAQIPGADFTKVTLEEVLSIGTLDDDTLFQWTGMAVDAQGSIYVLDAMDYSLKKFDARGRLIKKTGRKGEGPGEFRMPRLLDCSPTHVYTTDQGVLDISVFDHDLKFQKRIRCPLPVMHLKALAEGKIAVLTPGLQEPAKIRVLDGAGKVLSGITYMNKESGLLMDSLSFAVGPGGHFFLAFLFQDKIERWSADGRLLWTRTILGSKKTGTMEFASKAMSFVLPTETCLKDIALDSRGRVYVLGGKLSPHPGRDVHVLNGDGRKLAMFVLPDTSHCLYIDSGDFLYVRANDGITLKKYRMRYE